MIDSKRMKTFALIKFTTLEIAQKIQNGELYMNTLQYFQDLELQGINKGMGDKNEASLIVNNASVDGFLLEKTKIPFNLFSSKLHLINKETTFYNAFCMYSLDSDVCDIEYREDGYAYSIPNLEKEKLQKNIDDFGDCMLLIDARKFKDRVLKALADQDIFGRIGKVSYFDYSKNDPERIRRSLLGNAEICFLKDNAFKHQNEFRVIMNGKKRLPNGASILNIGSIKDCSVIVKPTEFFRERRYEIKLNSDSVDWRRI